MRLAIGSSVESSAGRMSCRRLELDSGSSGRGGERRTVMGSVYSPDCWWGERSSSAGCRKFVVSERLMVEERL